MNDKTFSAVVGTIVIMSMILLLVFAPVRSVISGPNYNYTNYCVDRFGDGFIPTSHEEYDLMKCYKIEDGDIIEKVFKVSLARKSAICMDEIGFWELSRWEVIYCNWDGDAFVSGDEK